MSVGDGTCAACGNTSFRVCERETRLARVPMSGRIVQCTVCGLAFVSPRPSAAQLEAMYRQSERDFRAAGLDYIGGENGAAPYLRERLARLEALTGGRGRLLDVGVGSGAFLKLASQTGWNASGSERIADAADALRRRDGLDVHVGDLTDLTFADGTFDVVHMNHVLEHLRDPVENLAAARRVLRPGGVLALEVPWEFADVPYLLRRLFGLLRPYAVPTQHLWFFTPATLSAILMAHGFQVAVLDVRRDCSDPQRWRQMAKQIVGAIERPLGRGPLITVMARRQPDVAAAPRR